MSSGFAFGFKSTGASAVRLELHSDSSPLDIVQESCGGDFDYKSGSTVDPTSVAERLAITLTDAWGPT